MPVSLGNACCIQDRELVTATHKNGKSCVISRIVPITMTLSDLEDYFNYCKLFRMQYLIQLSVVYY